MTSKKRGLGRGLDSLLGSAPEGHQDIEQLSEDARAALKSVRLDALRPGKHQPRRHFDEDALAQLAESIRSQGIIQPLVVRPQGRGRFEIIAGERRWRAAKLAELPEVPVIVREIDEQGAMAVALVENIQRADLNPLEEGDAIRRLIEECALTHAQAAEAVGRSRAAISNLLRLFDLPAEVQQMLRDGELSFGHARALLGASEEWRLPFAEQVIRRGLSVRQTEALVASGDKPARETTPTPDPAIDGLAESLAEQVGLPVSIRGLDKGRGRVTINVRDRSELEALLERLSR